MRKKSKKKEQDTCGRSNFRDLFYQQYNPMHTPHSSAADSFLFFEMFEDKNV